MKLHIHGELVGDGAYDQDVDQVVGELQPNVVVLDMNMSEMDPLRVIGRLKEQNPGLKVLVLMAEDDAQLVTDLLSINVNGDAGPIHEPAQPLAGGRTEPGSLRNRDDGAGLETLTPRELEVLTLVGKGANNSEIARTLYISKRTVENHISNMYRKLKLKGRSQAVLYAIRRGLVDEWS